MSKLICNSGARGLARYDNSFTPSRSPVQNDWLRAVDTQRAAFASQSPSSSLRSQKCFLSMKVWSGPPFFYAPVVQWLRYGLAIAVKFRRNLWLRRGCDPSSNAIARKSRLAHSSLSII